MRDNTKKPSEIVKGHWYTLKGRMYNSFSQMRKTFDEDGKQLVVDFAEKSLSKDAPMLWLRSKIAIRPKDSKLQPYFMYGRLPGRNKEEQMRFIHETRNMTTEQQIQWLEQQGYPKYGSKARSSNTQRPKD